MIYLPLTGPPLGLPFVLNRTSPQARGLVLWWPLIRSKGGGARDHVAGRALSPSAVPMTFAPDAEMGAGLLGNGSTSSASASDIGLPAGATERTIAVWARVTPPSAGNLYPMVAYGSTSAGQFFRIDQRNSLSGTGLSVSFSGHVVGYGSLFTGLVHLAAVIPPGATTTASAVLYVNGVPYSATLGGSAQTLNTVLSGSLYIARDDLPRYSGDTIFDARVYNRALSAAEVWALYAPQTRWGLYGVPAAMPYYVAPAAVFPACLFTAVDDVRYLSAVDPVNYFSAVDPVNYLTAVDDVRYFTAVDECPDG